MLKTTNRIIFFLSLTGLGISAYLLYTYLSNAPILCLNSGCELVRESSYSRLFNIPIPAFGALAYFLIFIFSFARTTIEGSHRYLILAILALSALGVVFSAYLTYLEAFKIKAFCIWCLASAGVISSLFITSAVETRSLK